MLADMTKEQLAWLAGILDGEGCLGISYANGGCNYVASIQVGSTDRCMLDTIVSWTGLGKAYNHRIRTGNRKPIWNWKIAGGKDILELLVKVFPYLVVKQKQAKLLIKFCSLKLAGEYNDLPLLYLGIRLLNKRGLH